MHACTTNLLIISTSFVCICAHVLSAIALQPKHSSGPNLSATGCDLNWGAFDYYMRLTTLQFRFSNSLVNIHDLIGMHLSMIIYVSCIPI